MYGLGRVDRDLQASMIRIKAMSKRRTVSGILLVAAPLLFAGIAVWAIAAPSNPDSSDASTEDVADTPRGGGGRHSDQAAGSSSGSRPSTVELPISPSRPDRVSRITDPQSRITITVPQHWRQLQANLTPELRTPRQLVAAGSLGAKRVGSRCSSAVDQPKVDVGRRDAFVHVSATRPTSKPMHGPEGPKQWRLLEQVAPVSPEHPAAGQVFPWGCLSRVGIVGVRASYERRGRLVTVMAVAGEDTKRRTRRELLYAIESVRFKSPTH